MPKMKKTKADRKIFRVGDYVRLNGVIKLYRVEKESSDLITLNDGLETHPVHLHHVAGDARLLDKQFQEEWPKQQEELKKPTPKQLAPKKEPIKQEVKQAPVKPQRSMRWQYRSLDNLFGVLTIKNGDETDYFVHQVARSVFLMTKLEGNASTCYVVNIGVVPNCGCKGFEERGECRHVAALSAKREMGEV